MPQAAINTRSITYTCNIPMVLNGNELRLINVVGTTDYSASMPSWSSNSRKAVIKNSRMGLA